MQRTHTSIWNNFQTRTKATLRRSVRCLNKIHLNSSSEWVAKSHLFLFLLVKINIAACLMPRVPMDCRDSHPFRPTFNGASSTSGLSWRTDAAADPAVKVTGTKILEVLSGNQTWHAGKRTMVIVLLKPALIKDFPLPCLITRGYGDRSHANYGMNI